YLEKIKEAETNAILPNTQDLEGAAAGLGNLQHVYKLPISHLAQGRVLNNFTSVELDEWDWIRIGDANYRRQKYVAAWFWYNHVRTYAEDLNLINHANELIKNVEIAHDTNWVNTADFFGHPLSEVPLQPPRTTAELQMCRGETSG
ncbi:hypothetical protein SK128_027851, partial [Halocaridina rubra]